MTWFCFTLLCKTFPTIGAFAIENENTDDHDDTPANNMSCEIKDFKPCQGLDSGKCSCPKRELPPAAPPTCPFPPTVEIIDRLENWIREKYRASTCITCNCQPLPLMKDSPALDLFIDPTAKPIACHKPGKVPIHFKERVEAELRRDVRLGVLEEVPPNTP